MYGPEAFDDDPMWDESVDGPDVDASDELRHALPAYANKAISDIDAARIPADASGQIAAVQIALRPPYCDEIFGDDLLPWIPLLVLMFKQLSEPKMKSLGTLILDNAVRLIQLFMQRNTHAFRHVFADILQCVADLLEYTESDARTATEQAGLSARVLLLPNTLQHLTCASHRCEAMPCCSDELPTCNDHSGEPCFSVDISNDDRIDMLRSSFTLVLGQFMFDSMLVLDFIPAFADILKRQIRCAAPSVQEASSIALLDLVKSMVPPPESARVSLLSLFDIVSTDSFRTPTLELQVVQLVDWLLLPLPADQLKPYARALASLCPRVLEFAHCSELRFKVGDLMFHLHKLFPFMLLYLPSFRVCFDRAAALLPPMRSCFMHIVQTLPECFHSSSLTACDNVAVSDCVSSLSPSDVFHRTSWTFFQDALRRVSEQSPCASLDGISFVCDVFSCLQSVSRSNRIAKAVNELVYGLAEANSNPNNLESYKDALTALAKMAIRLSGTARSIIVFLLIQSMLDEDVSLRALAYQQICFVAQSSGMSTSELIRQPYVEETILKWLPQRRLVCDEVCEALLDVGVETFLEDALPLVLPKLVLDQAIEVLNEISTRLHVQLSTLVVERIAPILHHVLANPDIEPSRATKAIEFLCQRIVPGYRFSDLLKLSKQGLVVSLIDSMGIPAQRNSAEHALQILVLADSGVGFGEYKTSEQFAIPDASTMSAFCADFFLMICDNLNNVIQNSNTGSVDRKVQAVRSLKCLTQLVGPRLSNFASKMVATMKVGLERVGDPAVITEILLLFESFLDALAADHLGTCLSQIVVTLLSCWRSHASSALIRDRIVEILDRLLVGRKSELSKYFAELLPMIPEDPELATIRHSVSGLTRDVDERRSSVQAVFELLDILRQLLIKSTGVGLSRFGYYSDQPTGQLSSLLNGIPDRVLAFAAHACGAHTRALRHLEMHVRSSDTAATLEDLDFLQRVFADLDDADGMQGLSFLRTRPPSPVEQARDLESLGQWNDALICHQEQARSDPDHHDTRVALLHCLLRLGRYENCISEVAEIIGDDNHVMDNPVMSKLLSFGIESAWRSANWAALERFMIAHPDPSCFEVGLANVISAWRSDDEERVTATLQQARAYPFWAQLQLLNDFDLARTRVTASVSWPWQQRIASMQPAFTTREPILSVHRLVFEAACRDDLAGQCWLQLARESRLSSEFDQASYAVLRANRLQVRNACLEQAELLRARGNFSQALIVLEEHIASRGQLPIGYTSQERQEELSNMQCLVGELMQLSASRTSDSILSTYRTAIAHCSTLDKPHFLWGSFMDTLLRSELDVQIDDSDRRDVIKKLVPDIIHHYLLSVMSSSGYVFDTLPRVVTLWCEHAEVFVPNGTSKSKGGPSSNRVNDVAAWISDWIKKVPAHNWYVVLPQLVSRLQNENASVQEFLTAVIVRTFLAHPRQSTWIVASIEHYKSDEHRNPVMRILKSVGSKMNGAAREELQRAQRLLSLLVELCTFQIAKEIRSTRLPSNSAMTVAIPERPPDAPGVSSSDVVNPFPLETVMITGIDDHLNILPSKEKPRQARFLGSDGSYHLFLCKVEGEGDMRKNSRMMEVANVVNRLFRASPDSRRRRLRLRTYAVMPLREDCGIIEWVLNTSAFRAIVDFYQSDLPMSAKQAATYYEAHASEPVARYHHLRKVMQPRLHRFFMDTFPEPTTWYENRMLFTRSWAVWAMVGHIVGLGDRHGENILLDRSNGEVIHVDFDCLFDRGLNLRTPEVVPFRLTANALDGMGITQHEGVFRTSCNVAMRVLRDNSGVLQKCLETFVHDPLVEWKSKRVLHQGLGEKAMKNVENRLAGKIANSTLPVSVEGYVDHLIRAAMSPDNLGRMFVGWMPWS
ncbi:unnamed protein product (mitochondrion) [Plasmodiophora brassicae]|uniref:Serine/threonine-protein kinase ATR n=1 Tax=Plasmodiophora brassicae TaxID=37360 RepID=A0A3P3Y3H7_PLABS|nr:unnamed protein product [Plasmodiophora brassicae]